jgi:hypothetical protein
LISGRIRNNGVNVVNESLGEKKTDYPIWGWFWFKVNVYLFFSQIVEVLTKIYTGMKIPKWLLHNWHWHGALASFKGEFGLERMIRNIEAIYFLCVDQVYFAIWINCMMNTQSQ